MRGFVAALALVVLFPACKPRAGRRSGDGGSDSVQVDGPLLGRLARTYFASLASRPTFPGGDHLIAFDEVRGRLKLARRGDTREVYAEAAASLFVRTPEGGDRVRKDRVRCLLHRRAQGWRVRWCRLTGSAGHAKVPRGRPVTGAAGPDSVGITECDRLLEFYRCYAQKMPAASRASMEKAYRTMLKTYRTAGMNPSSRRSLGKACGVAIKSLRKVAAKNPQFRGCL